MCEINADTPSGEAETVIINRIFAEKFPDVENPNRDFEEKFYAMIAEISTVTVGNLQTIGIIYPTDMPEDLSMILLYKQFFEERGIRVILGSPYNIRRAKSGKIEMFGEELDCVIRHYKTDWWGERFPVWFDAEPFPDEEPIEPQLSRLLQASAEGKTAVVNPFGAIVVQNKCAMALLSQFLEKFSTESQEVIRRYVPETVRLCDVQAENFPKNEWVLKSDYGCEGDEVIIGKLVSDEVWKLSLERAIPEHWILQRYFEAKPIDGMIPNYGVYVIGGNPSGIYTRLSGGATDYRSMSAATLVKFC